MRRPFYLPAVAAMACGVSSVLLASVATSAPLASSPPKDVQRERVLITLSGPSAWVAADTGARATGSSRRATMSEVAAAKRQLRTRHDDLVKAAANLGARPGHVQALGLLYNGVAMTVDAPDVNALRRLPGVVSVVPDGVVRAMADRPSPSTVQTTADDANDLVGNSALRRLSDASGRPVNGTGVTVAVIDTGVDYTHPDLGGAFGPGHKVVGGWDFVDQDPDPMDENGHGTHVAGIIAAEASGPRGVTGAAPGVSILAYRALGSDGSGLDSQIIAAMEAAVDPANPHRADILNLSLGNAAGTASDPLSEAATAAVDSGIVVVAAAGNEGGYWTVGSPAAAPGVITVGASTSGIRVPSLSLPGNADPIATYRGGRSANPPLTPTTARVINIGAGTAEDWQRAGDVSGAVLLTAWPPSPNAFEASEEELALWRRAEDAGALALVGGVPENAGTSPAAVGQARLSPLDEARLMGDASSGRGVLVTHSTGVTPKDSGDSLRMDRLVIVGTDSSAGPALAAVAESGGSVVLSGRDSTDEIGSFSSRGPDTENLGLKPDLVAPGVEILSTVPAGLSASGYERLSGTSMATPLVAGSAALLRQLHPAWTGRELASSLIGSATPLPEPDLLTQGNGRLQADRAGQTLVSTSPSVLSMGLPDMDGEHIRGVQRFTIRNHGTTSTDVTLSAEKGSDGRVTLSPERLRIAAGATASVTVTVTREQPEASDAASAITEGRVLVQPDNGTALRVPYLLMALPLTVEPSVDPTTEGNTTVYVKTPTPLTSPPLVTVSSVGGPRRTVTTKPTVDPRYYSAELRDLSPGIHQLTASAVTAKGTQQRGVGAVEVVAAGSARTSWSSIGPNAAAGQTHLTAAAPKQAVMTLGLRPGAWRSGDGGTSWAQLNNTPVTNALLPPQLVVDARQPNRWWELVVSVHPSSSPGAVTFMRTEDAGESWERLQAPPMYVDALVGDATSRVLVAYATGSSDYSISRDGGLTWGRFDIGQVADAGYVAEAKFGGDDLFIWAGQSLWVIRDVATTPSQPERVFSGDDGTRLASWDVDGSDLAVVTLGSTGGVHVSTDAGRTWMSARLPATGRVRVSGGMVVHDDLMGNLSSSADGGQTWQKSTIPVPGAVMNDVDRWTDGSSALGLTSGLYLTHNGEQRRLGVPGTSVSSLASTPQVLLASTAGRLYRTAFDNTNPEWGAAIGEGRVGAGVGPLATSSASPGTVWSWVDGHVSRSADQGRSWEPLGDETPGTVTSLSVDPHDAKRIAYTWRSFGTAGYAVSTDGGTAWRLKALGRLDVATWDPTRPGRLWLGGPSGLYRSDDEGRSTTREETGEVSAIAITDGQMLLGGLGIRLSTDGGESFETADTGPLRLQVSGLLEVDGVLYASTTSRWMPGETPLGGRGVLESRNGGRTWTNVSGDLANHEVLTLAASPDGRYLYAGVAEGGVYRTSIGRR